MRSRSFPWGFPWLEGVRKEKVDAANVLMRRSIDVMKLCGELHIPFLFEFPEDLGDSRGMSPASAWQLPELKALANETKATRYGVYQSDYGTPYLKPTGFLSTLDFDKTFGVVGWPQIDDEGCYRGPLPWQRATPMKMGPENTAPTAAYPPRLCSKIAAMVLATLRGSLLQPVSKGPPHVPCSSSGGGVVNSCRR